MLHDPGEAAWEPSPGMRTTFQQVEGVEKLNACSQS